MATNKQTAKLPDIYYSEEFLAKYRNVTAAPVESVENLGIFLMRQYEKEGVSPDLEGEDPLGLLSVFEKAEHGDQCLGWILLSLDSDGKGNVPPDHVAAYEYWGERAIALREPQTCLQYMLYLIKKNDPRAIAAGRYACAVEDLDARTVAETIFTLNLIAQYPDAYETRICALSADTPTFLVQEYLSEAQKEGDPLIYIFLTMLLIERGEPFDKKALKEMCGRENFPHLYALLTGEAAAEKDCGDRYDEAVRINQLSKLCSNNDQHEYYLRLLFGYCEKYLDGNIDPLSAHAITQIQRRTQYGNQTKDLLVMLHAAVHSAKKSGFKELEENATEAYRKTLAMSLLSGGLEDCPNLDDPVDLARLRQVFYFDREKAEKINELGTVLEVTPDAKWKGYLILKDGVEEKGTLVYRVRVSIPNTSDKDTCDDAEFDDSEITDRSNLIGTGVIRTLAEDRTKIEIKSDFYVNFEFYDLSLTAEVDLPFALTDQFEDVELSAEGEFTGEYYTMLLTIAFSPYDPDYEPPVYTDDEYEEEPEADDEEYDDEEDDEVDEWEGVTTFDGRCSVFVKFPGKTGYSYNYDGKISVGDKVKVSGKLSDLIGTVDRIEAPVESAYMQRVVEVLKPANKTVSPEFLGVTYSELVLQKTFSTGDKVFIRKQGIYVESKAMDGSAAMLYLNISSIQFEVNSFVRNIAIRSKLNSLLYIYFDRKETADALELFNALKGELYREVPNFDPGNIVGAEAIGGNPQNPYAQEKKRGLFRWFRSDK